MTLIAGLIGNVAAMVMSDIPFCMRTCCGALSGIIPLIGPAIHFIYDQTINIITQCMPTVFS
jgi:hypothetical protein